MLTQKGTRRRRAFNYCVTKSRVTKTGLLETEVHGPFLREEDARKWVLRDLQRIDGRHSRAVYGVSRFIDPYAGKHVAKEVQS